MIVTTPGARARVGAALVAAVVATLASGCVRENPTAIQYIGNAIVLRQPGGGAGQTPGTCIIDQSQFYRPFGTMDILIAMQYDLYPEMQNNLQPTATVSQNQPQHLRQDASLITLQGAEVTVEVRRDPDGPYAAANALPAANGWTRQAATDGSGAQYFTRTTYVPFSRSIKSLSSTIVRFSGIPPEFGEDLRRAWFTDDGTNFKDRYTANVPVMVKWQAEGKMHDGTTVRTQVVEYPVNLCWGCLLYRPTTELGVDQTDQAILFQQCSNKQLTVEEFTVPCVPGNDEAMPCGYYCHVCQQNESLQASPEFAAQHKCDERWCPEPP